MNYWQWEQCVNKGKCKLKSQCKTAWLCGIFFRRPWPKSVALPYITAHQAPPDSDLSLCLPMEPHTRNSHLFMRDQPLLLARGQKQPVLLNHCGKTDMKNEILIRSFGCFLLFALLPHLFVSLFRYLSVAAGHWKDFELHYFHLWPSAFFLLWRYQVIFG